MRQRPRKLKRCGANRVLVQVAGSVSRAHALLQDFTLAPPVRPTSILLFRRHSTLKLEIRDTVLSSHEFYRRVSPSIGSRCARNLPSCQRGLQQEFRLFN